MWHLNLAKAGMSGAISAAAGYACFALQGKGIPGVFVPMINQTVPLLVAFAVMGAGASLVSDFVHEFAKEEIHLKDKALDEASLVIGTGITLGSYMLAISCANPTLIQEIGLPCLTGTAVAAEVGSSFLLNMVYG